MWALSSVKLIRYVLVPTLSLWIAGAGCMLGCEGMVAAAASRSVGAASHSNHSLSIVASGHACSSAKSHECCAKNKDEAGPKSHSLKSYSSYSKDTGNTPLVAPDRSSSGMMNCPLAVGRVAAAAKARSVDASDSAALPASPFAADTSHEQTARLSTPLRLPNRGHTYLRCCVFLI